MPNDSVTTDCWYDPRQAAEYVGVADPLNPDRGAQLLAEWRSRGRGPCYYKIGGSIRYKRSDLDRWLDMRAVDTWEAA